MNDDVRFWTDDENLAKIWKLSICIGVPNSKFCEARLCCFPLYSDNDERRAIIEEFPQRSLREA